MLASQGMWWKLIKFALPIIGCGVVQQAFNSIDVAVVGRMVSPSALAAVGANGPVISLIITLFMGIAVGVNVVISIAIGAGDRERASRAVSTQMLMALVSGICLLIVGLLVSGPILSSMDIPSDILPKATSYLRLYALGFPAMLIYNFGSAVLRSVGDTLRPFVWLVIGGLVNLVLNLTFVAVFGMGVEGVALATSIANIISATGVVALLVREKGDVHLDIRKLRFHVAEFREMVRIGLPAGVQGTLFAMSNVIIQSAINQFGADAMAGSAAAITFELYGYFIISAFVQSAVAFISINYGAGNRRNCRRAMWLCLGIAAGTCFILNMIVVCLAPSAVGLLCDDGATIGYGVVRVTHVLFWQFVACSYEISGGAMRALGYSITPMLITLIGTCALRIWWVKMSGVTLTYNTLLSIYPLTWAVTGVSMLAAYFIVSRKAFQNSIPT